MLFRTQARQVAQCGNGDEQCPVGFLGDVWSRGVLEPAEAFASEVGIVFVRKKDGRLRLIFGPWAVNKESAIQLPLGCARARASATWSLAKIGACGQVRLMWRTATTSIFPSWDEGSLLSPSRAS